MLRFLFVHSEQKVMFYISPAEYAESAIYNGNHRIDMRQLRLKELAQKSVRQ